MSYTPTEWENGDIITKEKLNKIQGAIENLSTGGSGSIKDLMLIYVDYIDGEFMSDKTAAEIMQHVFFEGKPALMIHRCDVCPVGQVKYSSTGNPLSIGFVSTRMATAGDSLQITCYTVQDDNSVSKEYHTVQFTN